MNKAVGAILAVAGLGVGFGAGYFVATRRMQKVFFEALEEEMEEYRREFGQHNRVTKIYKSPMEAVEALIPPDERLSLQEDIFEMEETITQEDYAPVTSDEAEKSFFEQQREKFESERAANLQKISAPDESDDPKDVGIITRNLWDVPEPTPEELGEDIKVSSDDSDESEDVENTDDIPERDPRLPEIDTSKPYVISYQDFMDDSIHEGDKISLVYYEADDILADEGNQVINAVDDVIGIGNLAYFGIVSQDKNIVHIRNEAFEADYEVVRDTRSYAEVVFGVRPEKNGPRRMRDDDE